MSDVSKTYHKRKRQKWVTSFNKNKLDLKIAYLLMSEHCICLIIDYLSRI